MSDTTNDLPEAWANLLQALTLLARGQNNSYSPFHCEHDQLTVMADPAAFTPEEIEQLDRWGFFVASDGDGDYFTSFRYGSA
jgi:hypothetical protein